MLTADFSLGNVAGMTETEQNMAIEEALGVHGPWKEAITPCGCDGQARLRNPDGKWLRDFSQDLNACFEMEETLDYNSGERGDYWARLVQIIAKGNNNLPISKCRGEYHATSAQRAETFLRVKQLWKD